MSSSARKASGIERHGWMPKEQRYDHEERRRLRDSPARFKWLAGGRRSGKTMDGIDHVLLGHGPINPASGLPMFRGALTADPSVADPTFVVALPTFGMFRKIWWNELKRRVPRRYVANVNEQYYTIRYVNGAQLIGVGLDDGTRAEGIAIDGLIVDEFAYVKEQAWKRSLRPALSTRGRKGWAILQGKPAGRNHFYKGWKRARGGAVKGHDAFHWKSSVILSKAELAQARIDNDLVSYRQEYEASFESYSGLAYYAFGQHNQAALEYDPNRPLAFTWDFGTSPGTVAIAQVQDFPATHCLTCGEVKPLGVSDGDSWLCEQCGIVAFAWMPVLCIIDEAYQLLNSTTASLCAQLVAKWANRINPRSPVILYGDPAGFSKSTRGRSSDWDEIQAMLGQHFADVRMNVPLGQPTQRDRVNALNRLCQSETGIVRLLIDPRNAPNTVEDFENTVLKEDGSGHIDKAAAGGLYSHLTDAVAYLALREFPRRDRGSIDTEVLDT